MVSTTLNRTFLFCQVMFYLRKRAPKAGIPTEGGLNTPYWKAVYEGLVALVTKNEERVETICREVTKSARALAGGEVAVGGVEPDIEDVWSAFVDN